MIQPLDRERVPLITFFVPCLNEEGNVGRAIDTIVDVMQDRDTPYEVLVVDDASRDGSVAEVLDRGGRYPHTRIELIRNARARGLGRNYVTAAQRAAGEHFMMVCGDAVEPAQSIRAILSHLGEADAVVPFFGVHESRAWSRKVLSQLFTRIVNVLSGHRLRYYNGPVLHRTAHVRRWGADTMGFGYQAELLCRLLDEQRSVIEVPIANTARSRGESKAFTLRNLLSVAQTFVRLFLRRLSRQAARRGLLAFYWRTVVRAYPREVVTILALMVGYALLEAVTVWMTVPLLDLLTAPERTQQGSVVLFATSALQAIGLPATLNTVTFVLLVVASLLFLIRGGCFLLTQHETAATAVRLRRRAKAAVLDRFLHARYEEMVTRARGKILNDVNAPAETLGGAVMNLSSFFTGLVSSLVMVGLLLYLSWGATVLLGVLAIAGVQGWRWVTDRRAAGYGSFLYRLRGEQQQLQVDAIDGLKIVKAYGLERRMAERHEVLLAEELRPELRLVFFQNGPILVNEVIASTIMLGLGAATFFFPSMGIRFSILVAFLLAIRRIAPALATVNKAGVNLSRYQPVIATIDDILTRLPQERHGRRPLRGPIEELHVKGISFTYASRPEVQVLHDVDATLRRGTVTALVGPTGSGKSTLAHLVLGFYEPQEGSVTVNEVEVQAIDLHAWRRRVGYVPQDAFVFNATIKDNITLGDDEGIGVAQVEWAARLAQLHECIRTLPEGYDTVVGDRGIQLSGGQCQRLAIARALVRRPSVLIFDEATSALDNLTERAVYDAISALHADAIVIVIAHRLSTVRDADQILVLEVGRVVEQGTHESLIRRHGGVYARLYAEEERSAGEEPARPETVDA